MPGSPSHSLMKMPIRCGRNARGFRILCPYRACWASAEQRSPATPPPGSLMDEPGAERARCGTGEPKDGVRHRKDSASAQRCVPVRHGPPLRPGDACAIPPSRIGGSRRFPTSARRDPGNNQRTRPRRSLRLASRSWPPLAWLVPSPHPLRPDCQHCGRETSR